MGTVSKLIGVVPVARAQDHTFPGSGTISWEPSRSSIIGASTEFTVELRPGSSLKTAIGEFQVISIESDIELTVVGCPESLSNESFKVVPKVSHESMFNSVENELRRGGCIGIFPEGGSHDRTTLLPLKPGVCHMALGAMVKYGITVTIQAVGLNYFSGHKFRSKAVVNLGVPYTVPKKLADLYFKDKKAAVKLLLEQIQYRMTEV